MTDSLYQKNCNQPYLERNSYRTLLNAVSSTEESLIASWNDLTGDGKKIFMFTTTNNLKLLCASKYWVMDGTFKAAPNLFHQLYTIHCNIADGEGENCIVPVVYALMPGKSQEIYQKLFKVIPDYIVERPNSVLGNR